MSGFCSDICNDDEGYFDALGRMFEQALKFATALSVDRRGDLVASLDRVRAISHEFSYRQSQERATVLSHRWWRSGHLSAAKAVRQSRWTSSGPPRSIRGPGFRGGDHQCKGRSSEW